MNGKRKCYIGHNGVFIIIKKNEIMSFEGNGWNWRSSG
jgi:hypothetical protein